MIAAWPRHLLVLACVAFLTACAPTIQLAGTPMAGFAGPHMENDDFVSFDGARLGLTRWDAEGGAEPWAVIIGVHGMNAYARSFRLAGPYWATKGITTYAYDQRGFGRSPQRGIWAGDDLMTEDLRVITALVRARYPKALIIIAGESMGGAVAIEAFASDRPPAADRLILLSPGVWGWSSQPPPYKTSLWIAARLAPAKVFTPPGFVVSHVQASDNMAELVDLGRDPLMVWGARTDTLYGLVGLMERGWAQTGRLSVPTLYLYGAHDQIIPRDASFKAAARLGSNARTAYYANGWHLLLVDKQAQKVWDDVIAYVRDPAAPLPSGAPPIPVNRSARK